MTHICPQCNQGINDFDRIRVEIEATYHPLKSSVTYALEQKGLDVVGELRHANCNYPKGEDE